MNPQVGAASTFVRHLLSGPPQAGAVCHAGRHRAGVEVAGRLVVVTAEDGPGTLPCSVLAPGLDVARVGPPGAAVVVGAGGLRGAEVEVQVVRWWVPATVRPGVRGSAAESASDAAPAPADGGGVDPDTRAVLRRAAEQLVAGGTRGLSDFLVSVLGRGQGSTPDADDAVAGLLLAARAHLPASAAPVTAAVARAVAAAAPARTTVLSAELLRAAAEGSACVAVVRHLTRPTPETRSDVLALGASSGAATLTGVTVMAQALTPRSRAGVAA